MALMAVMLSDACPGFEGVNLMDVQSLHLRSLAVAASVLVSALMLSCTTLSIRADISNPKGIWSRQMMGNGMP